MKVAKKIVSFIMCLAIVAAMSVTAFAAPAEPQSAPISVMHSVDLWHSG